MSTAWLDFVKENFMMEDGCCRPDVEAELKRLEEGGELYLLRERHRMATDIFLSHIFGLALEERGKLFSISDARALALIQDRVKTATEVMSGLVQQGLTVNLDGAELELFFHEMLFQKPA